MKYAIKWLGHAAVEITTSKGTKILVDPWLTHGLSPVSPEEVDKPDIICITHDHDDHVGNAVELLKNSDAIVVAQPELLGKIKSLSGIEDSQIVNGGAGMNIGGTVQIKDVRITMVEAVHSSVTGEPSGFVIEVEGDRIYHAGDTSIMASMMLFEKLYKPKVSLLPIGGVFTMDPVAAAEAAKILGSKVVVPIHYETFPILEQSADRFVEVCREISPDTKVKVMRPGDTLEF